MITFYVILAASPALLLVTIVFFVLIVIGIRRRDRGDLASPSRDRIDAITRRMTGLGVRNSTDHEEGES
jgi:hypothetical protein